MNGGRQIDLITQNRAFTGPYVFHCHKLTHEDHGMMELVRVCDPATDSTCGDNTWRTCDPDDLACVRALAATDCYIDSETPAEVTACVMALGGPGGVCGPASCGTDEDCNAGESCTNNVCTGSCTADDDCGTSDRCDAGRCLPAPCATPCAPGQSCVHGACR